MNHCTDEAMYKLPKDLQSKEDQTAGNYMVLFDCLLFIKKILITILSFNSNVFITQQWSELIFVIRWVQWSLFKIF